MIVNSFVCVSVCVHTHVCVIFFLTSLLEYNCFTVLC